MRISDHSLLFATAFYHAEGKSPNAWTISEQSKMHMYYRCMVVCYASLRRIYQNSQLVLFTNRLLPEPFSSQLSSMGVETKSCPSRFVSDSKFKNGFPGCLFTLDVIDQLAQTLPAGVTALILLDNDCVVRCRVDELTEHFDKKAGIFAYAPGYPVNMIANGQSRASLTLALSYMQDKLHDAPIPLYGGEFYGIPVAMLPELARHVNQFWNWMGVQGIDIIGADLTEEHVMSVALAMCSEPVLQADAYIKRIWTTEHYSTVIGNEFEIPIWHLPSEKKRGFNKLYKYWIDRNGFDRLNNEAFVNLVNAMIPLHVTKEPTFVSTILQRVKSTVKYLLIGRL